ncbi:MAG: glycosyltransferase [Ignavibacteria bacterium]|jgi:glycosyltransferase involved in cell wall biosynthesis
MISLIIAVYKNVKALDLIFQSLSLQTFQDFEALVAEDGQDEAMHVFIDQAHQSYRFPIRHLTHEDDGFRKIVIGNEAIRNANGEYVIFIDGDCILHPRFIEEYHKAMKPGSFYFGRRVLLGPKTTRDLYTKSGFSIPSTLSLLLSDSTQVREALYLPFLSPKEKVNREIWGCNWGVSKQHLLEVNGFDEDYTLPCFGEDLDIDWRLAKLGLKRYSLKNKAIQYHMYHPLIWDKNIESRGRKLYEQKRDDGFVRCLNGIEKRNIKV